MKFSVVIPCYNAAEWIGSALTSVATQTHAAHEIIVVDDDSTDKSIEAIQSSGVPVRLLRTHRANGAGARNAGISAAAGDWIALLDADDVWYPNHLARASALLSQSNDVAFMSNHDWITLEGSVIAMPPGFQCRLNKPTTGTSSNEFILLLTRGFHFGHSTVVYRRDRLCEVGAFDVSQRRRHDIDLWLRMIHGKTWTFDTVKGAGYRVDTPGSISKDLISCEYYYLRALLKNSVNYPMPEMEQLIRTSARRGMGLAFVDGTERQYKQMADLSWPQLASSFRAFYGVACGCPALFRWFLRMRRRIIWRGSTVAATS